MAGQTFSQKEGGSMRRVLLPLIILIVLIAVYLFIQNQETESIRADKIEGFVSFNPSKVDSLVVEMPKDTLKFQRLNNNWNIVIDSVPRRADSAQVAQVVEMISSIDVGSLVSENPEKQNLYEVDSSTGRLINVYGHDENLASFYLGKNASNFNYTYIRKVGSDEVYMAEDVMGYRLDKAQNNWRDKTIIKVDTAALNSIVFQYPDQEFTLERRDSLWFLSGDGISGELAASSDSVELFKRLVWNLQANSFYLPEDSSSVDPENPELKLTFKYISGGQDVLHVLGGNESKTRYYMGLPELDEPFVVLHAKYSGLTRRPNNFAPAEKNG
jgi:hypothetical protein